MNHEQLLNDFIDGTLDFGDEVSLFAELVANEHLRGDLRTLLLIQRGARNSTFAYVPMRGESEEIFRQLGFSPGASRGVTGAAMGWDRFGRLLHGITGGIIGVLLTLAFIMWQPDLFTHTGSGAPGRVASSAHGAASQQRAGAASTAGRPGAVSNGPRTQTPQPMRSNGSGLTASGRGLEGMARSNGAVKTWSRGARPSDASRDASREAASIVEDVNRTAKPPLRADDDSTRAIHIVEPATVRHLMVERVESDPHAFESGGSPLPLEETPAPVRMPIELEIRSLEARSFDRVPALLDQPSKTLLRNMAIGVRYDLSESFSAGIEFGQEMFYQTFTATAANGDVVEHRQNPLLPWGCIAARYNLYRSEGLNPYVQLSLGATQVGPMARAMAGGYYEILPELRIMAGLEASGVGYSQGGAWFFSRKYGVTYGLSVNF